MKRKDGGLLCFGVLHVYPSEDQQITSASFVVGKAYLLDSWIDDRVWRYEILNPKFDLKGSFLR